ncbi:MAG TPA: hypothetical protein VHO06_20385 [Polyangia bacterium]|nr:hypothetical protein [Polyangia bacterium]
MKLTMETRSATLRAAALAALFAACTSSAAKPGTDGGAGDTGPGGDVPSDVVSGGFVTAGPWAGYGFTATDPGAATITPDCSSGACVPPFTGSTFCMHGTVTGRADYTGFAMLGWNVAQADGGAAGTWAVPASGGITVTVDNPGATDLRLQLQGTDPHSGSDRWCVPLVSGQLVPWTSFLTNCWTGGTPQTPLAAGTPIEQASILVPGLQTDLPFDVCLVDIQITP